MQKKLFFKALIIAFLSLLILIPLSMIENTITSRIRYRAEAVRSIAQDSVGEQTLLGPMLVIPYTEHFEELEFDELLKTKVLRQRVLKRQLFVFPNSLEIGANIDTDERHRGNHKVLVYSGQHNITGDFEVPQLNSLTHEKAGSQIRLGTPFISLGLSDTRGLKNVPKINLDGVSFEFQQNSQLSFFKNGVHARALWCRRALPRRLVRCDLTMLVLRSASPNNRPPHSRRINKVLSG
jgi:inner membrane protein